MSENKRIWKDYKEASLSGVWEGWPCPPFDISTIHGVRFTVQHINHGKGILEGLLPDGRGQIATFEYVDINSIESPTAPSPSPDREVGGDGKCPECGGLNGGHANYRCSLMPLKYAQEMIIEKEQTGIRRLSEATHQYAVWSRRFRNDLTHWQGKFRMVAHENNQLRKKLKSPSLPADKPVTLPYVKATDRLPEDGQQVFFRLKRPNEPAKYLGGFFKKDNRPDKTNGGDLSGFTDDRNLYALSININYIDWVDEYSLADKFPSLPIEDKQIHVNLPSGGVARVDENASAELLGALDKMVQLAKENVPIEEGADLKRIESDAISNLPEYLKDGREKGRFAWEEGYRAGATNEGSSLRTQLQSLISDNDSLRKEAQQLQQDNEDDAHRAHVTIQSLTEERDALKTTLAEQKVEREKLRQERNDYRRILDSIEKDNDEESRILSQPNMEIIHELLKQYPSQQ